MVRMIGAESHLQTDVKVRLRDTVDPSVYGDFACVGNVGWIRDRREDKFGFPEVLIEWDKDHWAYNGVTDCWTFADHFELVEDSMKKKDKGDAARQAALDFADSMASLFGADSEPKQEEKSEKAEKLKKAKKPKANAVDLTKRFDAAQPADESDDDDDEAKYEEAAHVASELLESSDAFIVIGVDDRQRPFAFGYANNTRSELATELHLAAVAARAHQESIMRHLADFDDE